MKKITINIPEKNDIQQNPQLNVYDEIKIISALKQISVENYLENILKEHAFRLNITRRLSNICEKGYCPNCYLDGKKIKTYAIPIIEAVKNKFIHVSDDALPYLTKTQTHFVVCKECYWWGYPSSEDLDRMEEDLKKGFI